jgi:dipeptidyl aminopeptidase/acylaminoacyl peptidase
MMEKQITFDSDVRLTGVLRSPEGENLPGVLLNHGTMEQDRDGNMTCHPTRKEIHKRDFFLRMSRYLCDAGFATFSWDKRGIRDSEPGPQDSLTLVKDSKRALDVLCSQDNIDSNRIAIFGQSAGVYTTCLLAKDDNRAKAYILSGGLYRDCSEMMAFNYLRPVEYAKRSQKHLEWVEKNDMWGLIVGSNLKRRQESIMQNKREYTAVYKGQEWTISVDPLFSDPEYAPSRQFRYIRKPTFVVHGEYDLNVPLEDAYMIRDELEKNRIDVTFTIIRDADHGFHEVPSDMEQRLKERMSLECLKRPYKPEYFTSIADFLREAL